MSFYEDIAAALDAEGIESRVNDDILFVPVSSDLDVRFEEIDPFLPAANVYIADSASDGIDGLGVVLTSVVFSVEDAVSTALGSMATEQMVSLISSLLEGTDERISKLDFYHDELDPSIVRAEVAENSELAIRVDIVDNRPEATLHFVVYPQGFVDAVDQAIGDFWESDAEGTLTDEDKEHLFSELAASAEQYQDEFLDLGTYRDFDRLFDVLSLAADMAPDWEEKVTPLEIDDDLDFDISTLFDA